MLATGGANFVPSRVKTNSGATLQNMLAYYTGTRDTCVDAMRFDQVRALCTDGCLGIGEHRGREPSPVGSKKRKKGGRNVSRKQTAYFSWCTQQCSKASAREEVVIQSRVSVWHIWWRTPLLISVPWYYVTGCSGNHGTGVT